MVTRIPSRIIPLVDRQSVDKDSLGEMADEASVIIVAAWDAEGLIFCELAS
jgi:hypothetical protein